MDDLWQQSSTAFTNGARKRAASLLRRQLASTSTSKTLLYTTIQINQNALKPLSTTSPVPPPHPPIISPTAPPCLHLFREEVTLTAAYNHALRLMTVRQTSAAHKLLNHSLTAVSRTAEWVWTHVYNKPASPCGETALRQPSESANRTAWFATRAAVETIRIDADSVIAADADNADALRRWADIAASAFELMAAACLQLRQTSDAVTAASVAQSFRGLTAALFSPEDALNNIENGTENHENMDDDNVIAIHSAESTEDVENDESDRAKAAQASLQQADEQSARAEWLLALSHAQHGDWDDAIRIVLPRAQEALVEEQEDISAKCYYPSVYLAAVLLLRRGASGDATIASQLATCCSRRGVRIADSLALIARSTHGRTAISAWERVFAVEADRVWGLWIAAREFGDCADYRGMGGLLHCLEEVLATQGGERERTGVLRVGERHDRLDLTGIQVRVERARALAGEGEFEKAAQLLESHMGELGDMDGVSGDIMRDWAWILLGAERMEEAGKAASAALGSIRGVGDEVSGLLVKGEVFMQAGRIEEGYETACEAFRVLSHSGLKVQVEGDAEHGDVSWGLYYVRGICYFNIAVLDFLKGELTAADQGFAGAQVVFEKAAAVVGVPEGWRKFVERNVLTAAFGRCICLWKCGRRGDAAAHWVAKRGIERGVSKQNEDIHEGKFGDDVRRLDEICLEVWKNEEAKGIVRKIGRDEALDRAV